MKSVTVVGGGLAGCEAAWQLAERGIDVVALEQKPKKRTPAQTGDGFAELVCSNSMRGRRAVQRGRAAEGRAAARGLAGHASRRSHARAGGRRARGRSRAVQRGDDRAIGGAPARFAWSPKR